MDPGILLIVFKSTWLIFYYEKTVLLFPGDQIKVSILPGTKTQNIQRCQPTVCTAALGAVWQWNTSKHNSVIVDITWIK